MLPAPSSSPSVEHVIPQVGVRGANCGRRVHLILAVDLVGRSAAMCSGRSCAVEIALPQRTAVNAVPGTEVFRCQSNGECPSCCEDGPVEISALTAASESLRVVFGNRPPNVNVCPPLFDHVQTVCWLRRCCGGSRTSDLGLAGRPA